MRSTRRQILEAVGTTVAAAGLAGCQTQDRNSNIPNRSETPESSTPENNYEAQVKFQELNNIETIPIVDEENIDDLAGIRLEVEDQNGLEHIQLEYNDKHRDQPHTHSTTKQKKSSNKT